jgi:hypothetical protein
METFIKEEIVRNMAEEKLDGASLSAKTWFVT